MRLLCPWDSPGKNTVAGSHALHQESYWLSSEESTCQCRRHGFDPWVGKIPWRRKWQPTPVFWSGGFHRLCSPWDCKESDTTERLSLHYVHTNLHTHTHTHTHTAIFFLFTHVLIATLSVTQAQNRVFASLNLKS